MNGKRQKNGKSKKGNSNNGNGKAKMVPTLPRKGNKPRSYGTTFRVSGTEYVATLATTPSDPIGRRLLRFPISVSTIGPRLARLGDLYEKYVINNLRIDAFTVGPMTDDCQLLLAFDTDVKDDPPPEDIYGIQQMRTWNHNFIVTHSEKKMRSLDIRVNQPSGGYYTGSTGDQNDRFAFAGQLYVYVVAPPSTINYRITLHAHYDVTLFEPQLTTTPNYGEDGTFAPTTTWNLDIGGLLNNIVFANIPAIKGVTPMVDPATGALNLMLRAGTYIVKSLIDLAATDTGVLMPDFSLITETGEPAILTPQHSNWVPSDGVNGGYSEKTTAIDVPAGSTARLAGTLNPIIPHMPSPAASSLYFFMSRLLTSLL